MVGPAWPVSKKKKKIHEEHGSNIYIYIKFQFINLDRFQMIDLVEVN